MEKVQWTIMRCGALAWPHSFVRYRFAPSEVWGGGRHWTQQERRRSTTTYMVWAMHIPVISCCHLQSSSASLAWQRLPPRPLSPAQPIKMKKGSKQPPSGVLNLCTTMLGASEVVSWHRVQAAASNRVLPPVGHTPTGRIPRPCEQPTSQP